MDPCAIYSRLLGESSKCRLQGQFVNCMHQLAIAIQPFVPSIAKSLAVLTPLPTCDSLFAALSALAGPCLRRPSLHWSRDVSRDSAPRAPLRADLGCGALLQDRRTVAIAVTRLRAGQTGILLTSPTLCVCLGCTTRFARLVLLLGRHGEVSSRVTTCAGHRSSHGDGRRPPQERGAQHSTPR